MPTAKRKTEPAKKETHHLTRTMEVPLEAMFEDLPTVSAAHLDISVPGQKPIRLPLGRTDVFIGRDPDCGVHLPLANVSRRHARVTMEGDEHVIEDLDSTNGTFVNGVRVSKCVLRDSDQVRICEARMIFGQQRMRN